MADGRCAPHKVREQRALLEREGVRFVGDRVDMAAHRWDGR
jgi:alkylated DNA nucleotide flippase Atl1